MGAHLMSTNNKGLMENQHAYSFKYHLKMELICVSDRSFVDDCFSLYYFFEMELLRPQSFKHNGQ